MSVSEQEPGQERKAPVFAFIKLILLRMTLAFNGMLISIRRSFSLSPTTFKTPVVPAENQSEENTAPPPPMLRATLSHVWSRLAITDVPPLSYAITAALFLVALAVSIVLNSWPSNAPYILFFATVVIGAGIGGLRAGLMAVLLSMAALYLMPHPGTRWLSLILFAVVAVITSVVSDGLYLARQQAEAARIEAETSARRSRLLARASALLDEASSCEEVLESVARLVVPYFADWCLIDLVGEEGGVRRAAAVHKDRKMEDLLREVSRSYPSAGEVPEPIGAVLRSGRPALMPSVTDTEMAALAPDPAHLEKLRILSPQSGLFVPLIARSRVLGALSLVSSTPERRYSAPDLVLANDLASRLALALDNSRLYQEAQQEIAERKRAEAEAHRLNEQLQLAMTETHHRVKNNLQVITAMIDMLLMEDVQTYSAEEFKRLKTSIGTLAMVHDLLTHATRQSGQVHRMSSREVLEKLFTLMRESGGNDSLEFTVEDTSLSAKQCTSLALIANELVSNAIKHGHGKVRVGFRIDERAAILEVCDNGPGFPPDFNSVMAANTGLELVENLSRWDLHGQVRYGNRPEGGQVILTFPLET